jgi:hypothetical protein
VCARSIEEIDGNIDPYAAVLLREVRWQLTIGHQVKHLEFHSEQLLALNRDTARLNPF